MAESTRQREMWMRKKSQPGRAGFLAVMNVRTQSAYVAELCDMLIMSGRTGQHESLRLLPAALQVLVDRSQRAIEALQEPSVNTEDAPG